MDYPISTMYDDEFIELMSKASFGQSGYALSEYLQEPHGHKSFIEVCLVVSKRILTSFFLAGTLLEKGSGQQMTKRW